MNQGQRQRPNRNPQQPSSANPPPSASQSRGRIVDAQRHDTPREVPAFSTSAPTWRANAVEWARGKLELIWESLLLPLFGWFSRRFSQRGKIPGRRMHNTGSLGGWSWNEQGARMLKRTSRLLMVIGITAAALVLFAAVAVRISAALSHATANISIGLNGTNTTPTPIGAITIRNMNGEGTPIGIPAYTFGMWSSNQEPSRGETITIYGRVSHYSAPVAGATVVFSFDGHTVSTTTDGYGLATVRIYAGAPPTVPDEITGSVSIGGQTLTGSTFYSVI